MKKLKRSVAVSVSLIMALSLMPQMAMAATVQTPEYTDAYESYFYDWERGSNVQEDIPTTYSCVTNAVKHSGNHSLVLRYATGTDMSSWLMVSPKNLSLGEGTYTLSFWAARSDDDSDYNKLVRITGASDIFFGDKHFTDGWAHVHEASVQKDGDWKQYSLNFTVPAGRTVSEVAFASNGKITGWYVDDISLTKEGTTYNLIKNGGFESTGAPVYTNEYESYFYGWSRAADVPMNETTAYSCVTNEVAHEGEHSLALRYATNGPQGNWLIVRPSGLSLGEGTYTLSFWSAENGDDDVWCKLVQIPDTNIVSGSENNSGWAYTYYAATGKKEGVWKEYSLSFTVPAGQTVNNVGIATNGNTKGWYIDDISLVKQGTTENLVKNGSFEINPNATYTSEFSDYLNLWGNWTVGANIDNQSAFYCATDEFTHDGEHSLAIRYTAPTETANTYISVAQDVSYGSGTYTISFWATGDYSEDFCRVTLNGNDWQCHNLSAFTKEQSDGIWTKYTKDITVNNDNNAITFLCVGKTNGWYIDDISFVKQGTTENLIKNNGFEEKALEEYTTEYDAYRAGWGEKRNEKSADKYLCVAGDVAHSGDHSIHIRHTDSEKTNTVILSQDIAQAAGTYTVSFWSTGYYSEDNCKVVFYTPGNPDILWQENKLNSMTKVGTDGAWTKYEKTVTLDERADIIRFTAENADTPGWYIDDISLVKEGSTKNIIKNAGFELTEPEPDETTPAQDFPMSVLEGSTSEDANGNLSMAFVSEDSIDPTEYKTVRFGFTKDGTTIYKGYALNKLISTTLTLGEGAFVGVCLMDIPAEYKGNVSMWLSNDTLVE